MKIRYIIIILLLIAGIAPAGAASRQEKRDHASADSAYAAGDYSGAISRYEAAMELYGTSASSLYDLGNAFYQSGDLGNARLCYERARKLNPSGKLINNNLKYVITKVEDANRGSLTDKKLSVEPAATGFFEGLYKAMAVDLSSDSWARMAAIAFVLLLCCVAMYLFSHNVAVRKVGFFGGGLMAFFAAAMVTLAFVSARAFERRDDGVIMAFKTPLLAEPASDAKAATSPLHRGTKLHILAEETGPSGETVWYKVRLNDDFSGWIPARDFEVI